ncbi:MAG: sulfatase-like hydrolase/transferase [Planctomycetes bacterium]|nr:sulfatase-like hydrolase/transferase [Planctomycetota bacterium]
MAKEPKAAWAGMISRLDRDVGRIVALVRELGLEKRTLIMFTSDNGAHAGYGTNLEFFKGNGDLRGTKGTMYEGGLRVPLIAFWPGRIKPGSETDHLTHFADMMPTFAELAGVATPAGTDGISIVPTLLGRGSQAKHEFLYWDFRSQTAVRVQNWKAIQPKKDGIWELYDLANDVSETINIADQHPDILARMKKFAEESHEPVRAGTYRDRTRHERDRNAKWGSTPPPTNASRGRVK